MKIGILSDTHDHKPNTRAKLDKFKEKGIQHLIHCGDFCSPFMIALFSGFKVDAVFGNNDGDIFLLQKKAEENGVCLRGGFAELHINGKKIAVYHGTYEGITNALVHSGLYDVVLSGHIHIVVNKKIGNTLHLNAGTTHGFEAESTAMILDLETLLVELI
ncbi:YfcE family phosphodiesterase [bacterium]|nr:MAG: YfcE family phosphodiesterase [bacterium]